MSDYLATIHISLHEKTKDIRSGLDDIEIDRRHHDRRVAKIGQLFARNVSTSYKPVSNPRDCFFPLYSFVLL